MIIGVPTEIKDQEYRVALTAGGVETLVHAGHRVLVQQGAGTASGFTDDDYSRSGAEIVDTPNDVWSQAELILKVKEPLPCEYPFLRPGLLLFTYLHLAANEELVHALSARGVTALGYETVQLANGSLPLLTPMSEVAGRMVVQIGAHYLEVAQGGRGVLLGGVPGVRPGSVVIIGGGIVGTNAAQIALGLGARVTVIDVNLDRLRYLDQVLRGSLSTVASNRHNITEAVRRAELLIGAVLLPGARTPVLVTEEIVASMAPGSVIVDVAIDQGGCIETVHPTSHSAPTYVKHGVLHYGVPNIPGAVPRTSSYALSNATLPYVLKLADLGFAQAVQQDAALRAGVNIHAGQVTCSGVAEAFDLPCVAVEELL
ncbi:MAG TPA: alanine dehydrogenase [Chloroflexi bacterium]|jgi:alanine dehydrogenase|nr:alanine dehydrogenase [Chloroflexota bacterium]